MGHDISSERDKIFDSIDGSLLSHFENKLEQAKIINSSNEILLVELSPKKKNLGLPSKWNYFKKENLYKFAATQCNKVHLARFRIPYYLATSDAFHAFAEKSLIPLHSLVIMFYNFRCKINQRIETLSTKIKSKNSTKTLLQKDRNQFHNKNKEKINRGICAKKRLIPFLRLNTNFDGTSDFIQSFSSIKKELRKKTKESWVLIKDATHSNYQIHVGKILRRLSKSRIKKLSIIFVGKTSPFLEIRCDKLKLFLLKKCTSCFSEIIISKAANNCSVSSRLLLLRQLVRDFKNDEKIPICLKKIY